MLHQRLHADQGPDLSPSLPELASDEAGLDTQVRACVRHHGAAVVCGVDVEDDDALLAVASALGEPSATGNGSGLIHAVTPTAGGTDVSQTTARFPLHTDSTFMARPHDFVVLGCQHAPPGRVGESVVVAVGRLVERLGAREGHAVVTALGEPAFWFLARDDDGPMQVRAMPVLDDVGGDVTVRYRDDALARGAAAAGAEFGDRHRTALAAFERTLSDTDLHACRALAPGEVLLVDNRRALHGRTAIGDGAARLLRRVKVVAR